MTTSKDTVELVPLRGEAFRAAERKIIEAGEIIARSQSKGEYLGTIALHFFVRRDPLSGDGFATFLPQPVRMNINPEVIDRFMPEIRDAVYKAAGVERHKLSPPTVEEVQDTGGSVIKTRFDE